MIGAAGGAQGVSKPTLKPGWGGTTAPFCPCAAGTP